jgi:multiple sugar transport system ATP-binding protein
MLSAQVVMAPIELDHVSQVVSGDVAAVDDVSLTVHDGDFMVLVGPSGCGKSTLLRMIAGLEEVTAGSVLIDGKDVTDLAPRHRDVAMVFQSYALYPHMSVRDNMAYGLKVRRAPKIEITRRVDEVAELLGLRELLERRPAQLSGGQRQRVAMGRAIVREPKAFLMDEPLSNLDAKLRVSMRASLAQLHSRLGVTTIYVTHDQTEAMTLGHRVAVMRGGRIVQVDAPQRLYESPRDLFVAGFIGSPAMSLVEAAIDGADVVVGQFRIPLDPRRRPAYRSGPVVLGIRPEAFEDAAFAPAELPRLHVQIEVVEELGAEAHVFFAADTAPVSAEARAGDDDDSALLIRSGAVLTARVNARSRARVGAPLELAVDPSRFHFFAADTGASLLDGAASSSAAAPARIEVTT